MRVSYCYLIFYICYFYINILFIIRVITGLRLVKYGRVFHLQISEGTLGERGSITPSGWVPIQKFDITDAGVKEGVDYHTLTYERRAIDLDELDSPSGHVLTGVRYAHGTLQCIYCFEPVLILIPFQIPYDRCPSSL